MRPTPLRGAVLLAALSLAACDDPLVAPAATDLAPADGAFDATADFSTGVHVLNTQLRGVGIIDPDIEPSPAWGHLQLKLTASGDDGFLVEWKGKLFNPDLETFSIAAIINPDIDPGPFPGDGQDPEGGGLILSLFRGSPDACSTIQFDSDASDPEFIPFDTGTDMIINPEIYEVVVVSESSFVRGSFGELDPTTVLGWNPQPDPPGRIRCEV